MAVLLFLDPPRRHLRQVFERIKDRLLALRWRELPREIGAGEQHRFLIIAGEKLLGKIQPEQSRESAVPSKHPRRVRPLAQKLDAINRRIRTERENACDDIAVGRFDPDNLEFTLATLDRRFLAGQFPLYQQLHQTVLPGLVLSEWNTITQKLGEMARTATAAVRGASLRDAELIASLLPPAEPGPGHAP